ncbi:MAG TPA: hypothetical protein VGJ09_07755 [Bryobacteraceae bacterium]|jgi:hypothetical protein
MSANDEMRLYLEELLDHESCCDVENCGLCQSVQNVYRLARNQIFSEVVYPDVTIAAQARVSEVQSPASDAVSIGRAA